MATKARFPADEETTWRMLLTYEEVQHRPPWLLRLLLPQPVSTRGDKTQVGADIPCLYQGGQLTKRILVSDAPHFLAFAVVGQHLGIEQCITALGGSYRIMPLAGESEIELTTRYLGRLRPRSIWRRIEEFLAHKFHRHILRGMSVSVKAREPQRAKSCQISPSTSHR